MELTVEQTQIQEELATLYNLCSTNGGALEDNIYIAIENLIEQEITNHYKSGFQSTYYIDSEELFNQLDELTNYAYEDEEIIELLTNSTYHDLMFDFKTVEDYDYSDGSGTIMLHFNSSTLQYNPTGLSVVELSQSDHLKDL